MNLISVEVRRKRQEAESICSLELVDVDGRELPRFSAGSHVALHLPGGRVRPYSLCNSAAEHHRYRVAVLRDPLSRGGSLAVHDLQEGDVLQISEPRNHFPLVPARQVLLFAGGIGITPILCMADTLARSDTHFQLRYSARSPARAAFIETIAQSSFADRVRFQFSEGSDGLRPDLLDVLDGPAADKHLFVCGPPGYMTWVIEAALAAGWSPANLHHEHFAALAVDTAGDAEFEVELRRTGAVVSVGKNQAIAQALAAIGVELPTSCEQGICGTCLTGVLEGEIDHRDLFLSDLERARNDQFTPCVSRAKAGCRRIVIDL